MESVSIQLYKHDEIWTKDGYRLGEAHHLCHRTKDVDPVLQLYPTYVHVVALDIGDDYYVPTDFIAGRDPGGRITLTVTMKQVEDRTWTRVPDFIIYGRTLC